MSEVRSTRSRVRVNSSSARIICRAGGSPTPFPVASTRSTWFRIMVVESFTCSAIVSTLGRSSVNIASACAIVGRTLVLTSVASASIFVLVLRRTTKMATRTPACNRTAIPVNAIKIVSLSVSIGLLQLFLDSASSGELAIPILQILGRSRLGRGFMVGLTTRLISRAELFLLLSHHVATFVGPLRRLLARVTRPILYVFAALFGARTQNFSGLVARTRGIQNSRHRPYT